MRSWIERQRHILDFTLSSLSRRKGKNIALGAIYTLVVFTLASVMFFTHALRREASVILKGTPGIVVQKLVAGRHGLVPLSAIEPIGSIRGVVSVKARLWGYYYDPTAGANYTLMVPDGSVSLDSQHILIGAGIAKARGISKGEVWSFRTFDGGARTFEILGTLSPESELMTSDLVLLSEEGFRAVFGIPETFATDLIVQVRNPKEVSTVAAKVGQMLPDTRTILREEILRTYEALFDWRSGIVTVVLCGALFAFIIFAWEKAAGLNAEEKKEIGVLKAIGWETSDVLLMKFWEGATLSLSSFLLGVILAYMHVFFSSAVLFEPVIKGWSVLYPEFRLTPFVSAYELSTLLFLTVVPYTVTTIIPSWRAATIDPDSVMRT